MTEIRAKFLRGEQAKYISHLDLIKVFDRALRRCNINIEYSKGFNPHPQMIFGLPISVGVTSTSEYADFELEDYLDSNEFIERLNSELPIGIRMLEAKEKKAKANIMASINLAAYLILVSSIQKVDENIVFEDIEKLMLNEFLFVNKQGKKETKKVDIKSTIKKIDYFSYNEIDIFNECSDIVINNNCFYFALLLSAGSKANLKPEAFIEAYNDIAKSRCKILKVHRTGMFIEVGDKVYTPLDDNVLLD